MAWLCQVGGVAVQEAGDFRVSAPVALRESGLEGCVDHPYFMRLLTPSSPSWRLVLVTI